MACYGEGSASTTISLPNGTVDINGNSTLDCCYCGNPPPGEGELPILTCTDPTACNYNEVGTCIFGNPCGTIFRVRAYAAGAVLDVFGNMIWCSSSLITLTSPPNNEGSIQLISETLANEGTDITRIYRTTIPVTVTVSFSNNGCDGALRNSYCCGNNPDGSINPGACPQGGSAFIEVLQGCDAQPAGCFASAGAINCGDTERGDCRSEWNRGISYAITPCLEIDCNC
jgi:hypothetical protein